MIQFLKNATNLMNLRNNIRGIIMLEIVISLFIIGIAAVVASTVIISSMQGNRVNKNELIAINLMREGMEAVRNIRDSNWLRYKANLDKCWNFWEDPEGDSGSVVYTCDPNNPNRITEGYYQVNIGRHDLTSSGTPYTYKWYLGASSLSLGIDDAKLTTLDSLSSVQLKLWTPTSDPNYKLYVDNTHPDLATPTDFYRQIQIEYPQDTNGDNMSDENDTTLKVTSVVVWFEKGQKKKIKSTKELSHYME